MKPSARLLLTSELFGLILGSAACDRPVVSMYDAAVAHEDASARSVDAGPAQAADSASDGFNTSGGGGDADEREHAASPSSHAGMAGAASKADPKPGAKSDAGTIEPSEPIAAGGGGAASEAVGTAGQAAAPVDSTMVVEGSSGAPAAAEPAAGAAGADAAGAGASGDGSEAGAGPSQPNTATPGGLSGLTSAQIKWLCARIDAQTTNLAWGDGVAGYCARRGLMQPEMCWTIRQNCIDGPELIPQCEQNVPDCPNVSSDEFVTCRVDTLKSFIDDNRTLSCDSEPPIPEQTTPASCVEPFMRCPALRALAL